MQKNSTVPNELIIDKIYLIKGVKVMLDRDLANLYGVETKQLKRQVRRNLKRFPSTFMFELSSEEYQELRSQIGSLKQGAHSKYPPFVFTEYGILMLSSVLNSDLALKMSVQIIETFVHLRELATNYDELMKKIKILESKNEEEFRKIYEIIKRLLSKPKEVTRTQIGYKK